MRTILLSVVAMIGLAALTLPFGAGDGALGQDKKAPEKVSAAEIGKAVGDLLPDGCVVRLGTTRFRHHDNITCLAISPDEKIVASTGGWFINEIPGNAIRLWDMASGKELLQLKGHTGPATNIIFSPDGNVLASFAGSSANGNDDTVCLWDVRTGTVLHKFTAHQDPNANSALVRYGLAFSPDGQLLASSGRDEVIRLWNIKTGKEHASIPGYGLLSALHFSPDGKSLAIAGSLTIRLIDVSTGKEIQSLNGLDKGAVRLMGDVQVVRFLPERKQVLSASESGVIRWWARDTGKVCRQIRARLLGLSANDRLMAIRVKGNIVIWDLAKDQEIRSFAFSGLSGTAFGTGALSPNGSRLTVADGNSICVIDTQTAKAKLSFGGHRGGVVLVGFTQDGKQIITAGDTTIRFWDWREGRQMEQFDAHERFIQNAALSKDGKMLASGSTDGTVRILDVAAQRFLHRLAIDRNTTPLLAFSPQGDLLAAKILYGRGNDTVQLWSTAEGKELRRFGGGNGGCALAFLPDGKYLAVLLSDIMLYDPASGTVARTFRRMPYANGLPPLVFFPDGRIAATAKPDPVQEALDARAVTLWEMASGTMIARFRGLDAPIASIILAPGGRYLVSGAWDGAVRLWDITSGKELAKFSGHRGGVLSLGFSPDGEHLVSGGSDGSVLVWDVKSFRREGASEKTKLSPDAFRELWGALANEESSAAYPAIWKLVAAHDEATALIRENWHGGKKYTPRVQQLVKDLESGSFQVREKATRELNGYDDALVPILREALMKNPSAEARNRLLSIIAEVQARRVPGQASRAELQSFRVIQILEYIGSAAARQLLEEFTRNDPRPAVREDAKSACDRLATNVRR